MKVLHLWKSDSPLFGGGGAIAMYRLHLALREAGVDSKILCEQKTTDSSDVSVLQRSISEKLKDKLLLQIISRLGLNDIHRISSFNIKNNKTYKEADIIHFHGTQGGFINYLALPTLTKNRPSLFTLHDMCGLTGHCANSYDCDRWKTGCGKCPYPHTYPAIKRDGTAVEWKLKDWAYGRSNLSIISPSKWLTELSRESPLLNRFPIHHIPNGINTKIFQPLDCQQCRWELGIASGKKVLMFASVQLNDPRKGGDLLLKALDSLPQSLKAQTILLLMGASTLTQDVGMPVLSLGYIKDEHKKAVCYSASDLFIFPTRADNHPLVLLESMACGTPMVSFKIGGVPESVRPGVTGYLAEPENVENFRNGIVQLLEDESLRHQMGYNCRAIALEEYDSELYALRHKDLYHQILNSVDGQCPPTNLPKQSLSTLKILST